MLYREETPFDDDLLDKYISNAHKYHDELVEMGGRPTRKVLEEPAGKAVYGENEIRIFDGNGEFQGTVAPDENLILHHWIKECALYEDELDRWQDFRNYQQTAEKNPLFIITFDPGSTDQRLIEALVRLNDWREFQLYQHVKVGMAAMSTWRITRHTDSLMGEQAASQEPNLNQEIQSKLATCFREIPLRQHKLEASQIQLTWIKNQIPEILTEVCASFQVDLPLHRELEAKLEQQACAFYQELKNLEAIPDVSMQYPHESADKTQRICHWGLEITRLMEEYWEWKIFRRWRKTQPYTEKSANVEEQELTGYLSGFQIRVDFVNFRKYQLDRTRSWVACWQGLQKNWEDRLETTTMDQDLFMLKDTISFTRAGVKKMQQEVHTAELNVLSAEQQLAKFSSQVLSSAITEDIQQSTRHPQLSSSAKEAESSDSNHGDSTKMADATDHLYLQETVAEDEVVHHPEKLPDRVEDALMADIEVPVTKSSAPAPRMNTSGTRGLKKSPLPIYQVQVLRKSRCSTKLDKSIASKVYKDKGEKPAKRAKTFTKQQNMALLNATSVEGPPQDFPPLRRSHRLKDKTVAPSLTLSPQANAAQPHRSSRQREPGKQPGSVNPLSQSTRKTRRTQSSPIETSVSPRQKRLKT